jgi:ParB-like chromosome segregation protein Spo0J
MSAAAELPPPRHVSVAELSGGDTPRLSGESAEHIEALAAARNPLPPILVHRPSMRVIDGMHRLKAAMLTGQESIEAQFFDGSGAEAFLLAVSENVAHGLPLSRADREAAAARIIELYPQYSDRRIAGTVGLSHGAVAAVRQRVGLPGGLPARLGRDGRSRPVDQAAGRRLASAALARNPQASLRAIARIAGISPTTARDVRDRIRRGDDPVPDRMAAGGRSAAPGSRRARRSGGQSRPERAALLQELRRDPALRLTESGRGILRWISARRPDGWQELVGGTPPHCAYAIAELARHCADEWLAFAEELERRLADMD